MAKTEKTAVPQQADAGENVNLGGIPVSADVRKNANIGLWAFELDEGAEPRMYVDDVMLGLIGLTEQTTPEKTYHAWYDHVDPEHYDEVTESVEQMTAGVYAEVQYPWHHPDGRIMIVRCGGVRNPAYTRGVRIEGTHVDITSVVHFERERRLLREQMARVMELSENFQAIYDVDLETGDFLLFSYDNGYSDSVLTRMENSGNFYADTLKDVEQVVYPEDRNLIRSIFSSRETIRKILKERERFTLDYRLVLGGKPVWYRVRIVKKPGTDGRFLVGVFNVDDRVRKEKERKRELENALAAVKAEARTTKTLYDAISAGYDVMYRFDTEQGRTEFIKGDEDARKFLMIFNATTDVTLFENFDKYYINAVIHEDDREKVRGVMNLENIYEQLKTSSEVKVSYRVRRNLTDYVYTEMSVIKAGEHQGKITAVILAFRIVDAEVRKRLADENTLKEALVMAQSANRAKTAFLTNMSHDIRTPMNAITGYTALAKKHVQDPEYVSDYLHKIEISSQQLLSLVNQVLEMSRIESGKVVLSEEPADVIGKAYDMRTLSGTDIENKNLTYNVNIKNVPHRHVLADGSRMNQVMLNIIGNAIKYTPEGGRIDYTVEELPSDRDGYGLYAFTVADTGIGMSEEFQKHLFEEFARENSSTVSHIQGTGLGMPIVKRLVDLMGGEITVKSKLGEGTTITVTVPMKLDEGAETRYDDRTDYFSVQFKGKRILLVEDNEMNREIARHILEDAGFVVDTAVDGDIAVDMVKKSVERMNGEDTDYDAVLMDIQMPRMNGYDATRLIRKTPPMSKHLPIIAVSANAFEEDRQKSLEAGMDDHVAKPIDIGELKRVLARYI